MSSTNRTPDDIGGSPESMRVAIQRFGLALLEKWYHLVAPPLPPVTANLAQRERARRGRLASLAAIIVMVFLFVIFLRSISSNNAGIIISLVVELGACVLALFLNQRGLLEVAGVLLIVMIYTGQTLLILSAPGGLTADAITTLDFSILPDVLALAFFSANSLFVIVGINIIQVWAILTFGPHDATVAHLLQMGSDRIFTRIYDLQLITAAVLYILGRSVEHALTRADRAEEIAAFERREKERQQQELEQKRQLDAGIQEILQTHVAVANGDLNARAPLHQDNVLWKVAVALNNLIARHQSLSNTERELRQELQKKSQQVADQYTGEIPKLDGSIHRSQGDRS